MAKGSEQQPAPAIVRQGVYQAIGAGLVAGAAALVVVLLNPPRTAAKSSTSPCACSGNSTQAKVYG